MMNSLNKVNLPLGLVKTLCDKAKVQYYVDSASVVIFEEHWSDRYDIIKEKWRL